MEDNSLEVEGVPLSEVDKDTIQDYFKKSNEKKIIIAASSRYGRLKFEPFFFLAE